MDLSLGKLVTFYLVYKPDDGKALSSPRQWSFIWGLRIL